MIKLIEPNEKYLKSYIEAYDEYNDNHVITYGFNDARSYNIFEKYYNYKNELNLKPNRIGADYFWLVNDEKDLFIGEICIRHNLTDELLRYGGHIGYGIRYSEWNKGHGTFMLKLALEKAKNIGISKVIVTCDDNNLASAKIIEKNDFVFQDKVENIIDGQKIATRIYWKNM